MKTYKYLLGLLGVAVLSGCNDLDTLPMGDIYTNGQRQDVVANDPEAIEAQMSAVYANLYGFEQNLEWLGDFGIPATILGLENRSQDQAMPVGLYGWFEDSMKYTDNTSTTRFTTCNWGNLYKTIYSINDLLKVVDPETDEPEIMCYMAQAKAMRAWAYMMLVQLYSKPYTVDPQAPGVPVLTELNAEANTNVGTPRGTVADVYTQIFNDLNDAIALLTTDGVYSGRYDKRFVDPAVAYGLRARANLLTMHWDAAFNDADAAIQLADGDFALLEDVDKPAFNSFAQRDFMWGIHIAENEAHGLYTFAGMMGSLTYGYAYAGQWRTINEKLWDMIPTDDVRKGWWVRTDAYSPIAAQYGLQVGASILDNYIVDNSMVTIQGYPAPLYIYLVGIPNYAVVKFAPYQDELMNTTGATDIPLMRVEEMELIKAECLARQGDALGAVGLVEDFVNQYRWTGDTPWSCDAASAEEALDAVWFQRRIELWGEGFSYFDCLRMQKGIDRRGGGFPASAVFDIPANSPIFQYQIPTTEIEANPLLGNAQNPTGFVTPVGNTGNPYWYKPQN